MKKDVPSRASVSERFQLLLLFTISCVSGIVLVKNGLGNLKVPKLCNCPMQAEVALAEPGSAALCSLPQLQE